MALLQAPMCQHCPFETIPDRILSKLLLIGRARKVTRGEKLFRQGMIPTNIYLLDIGGVRIVHHDERKSVVLSLHGAGELFPLDYVFHDGTFVGDAEILQDGVIHQFTLSDFRMFVEQHSELSILISSFLSKHLHRTYNRVRELSNDYVEQRIAHCLMRLITQFGADVDQSEILITIPVSRQDIADIVGSRIETVSRIMRGWERDGVISGKREELRIHAVDFIEAITKGEMQIK